MPRTQSTKDNNAKRSYRDISPNIRQLIIDQVAVEGKLTQAQAARIYNQHPSTVRNILDTWHLTGRVDKKPRGGRRRKVIKFEDKHGEYITELLDDDCTQTLDVVREKLMAKFPDLAEKNISTSGLWRYMTERMEEVKERRGISEVIE